MTLAKHPIQIYLDEGQNAALRRLAKKNNVSLSELIRHGIELLLNQVPVEEDPAFQIIGLVSSGVGNIAENHDEYLVQEIEKEWKQ
jgi:16S rRNA U516 pseudouridylate synthase RsuA-like enzyme